MCYKYGPETYNFHLKLSLQVILGVSDIHLRLCKPKEKIHWAKKATQDLPRHPNESDWSLSYINPFSHIHLQIPTRLSLTVPFQIQDTYEWQVTLLSLQNPQWHSWTIPLSGLQNLQPQARCSTLAEELSLSLTATPFTSHRAKPPQCHLGVPRIPQWHSFSWWMLLGWTADEWYLQGTLQRWYVSPYMALVTKGCKDAGWISASDQQFWNVLKQRGLLDKLIQHCKVRGNS